MFGLFDSVEKTMRKNAANWLELAEKIYHYRRDELKETERAQLQQRMEVLRGMLRDKADASKLKLGIEQLEEVLRRTGGTFYPKSTLQEYVEFFLVAAIVVLGVRTYFLQPFKIPTNSMYPSYYGMTPEVFPDPATAPGPLKQAARFILFGAQHKQVIAPQSGPISIPVGVDIEGKGHTFYEEKPGRKWLIIPTTVREYTLFIGETPVTLQVPGDFEFDWVISEYFGITAQQLGAKARASSQTATLGNYNYRLVSLDKEAERGKQLINFDVLTGDQLFVDRFSYHFFPPKVGEGFVFRTGHLYDLHAILPRGPKDQYYIKRLVGLPGDKLEIKEPVLYRNGAPITGAAAFDKNARREGKYPGYSNVERDRAILAKGKVAVVPPDFFLPLGDNSASSLDGRYWGYVPKADAVGRPLFIYYPFTRRWGPAR